MRFRRLVTGAAIGGVALLPVLNAGAASAATPTTFVPHTSTWKVLDSGTNQTATALPATTHFASPAYDDSTWTAHTVQANKVLGYGDNGRGNFPTQTPNLSYGPSSTNKYITTYFRTSFSVTDPNLVSSLDLLLRRDDGAIVYLNGVEVYRTNMPAGTVGYQTWSSNIIDGAAEYTPVTTALPTSALVAGTNVVAVELHQRDGSSSDITFAAVVSGALEDPAPEPVVPEAPLAVLLPVGAGVVGGAVLLMRRHRLA